MAETSFAAVKISLTIIRANLEPPPLDRVRAANEAVQTRSPPRAHIHTDTRRNEPFNGDRAAAVAVIIALLTIVPLIFVSWLCSPAR